MSNRAKSRISLRLMVVVALLTAMQIIFSRLLSYSVWNMKIGLAFVPVMLAGMVFGPLAGALVGGLSDFIGALLFPIGPYFPGFTLTAALTGAMFGWVLHKRQHFGRVCGVVLFNQLVLGLLVNSFWISVLYGSSYTGLLLSRLLQYAILVPIEVIITWIFVRALTPVKSQLGWKNQ
ncbi:MAG: folate family ECF transporter S component [Oscillospiraceae bacterium]|nr:folate family ECF transporter S component [Oscillospiraceae bacterium]